MRRCAFLSMSSLAGFYCDDECAYPAFRQLGWAVEAVDWRRHDLDWRAYDAVIMRSCWDYPSDHEAFLDVLAAIESCDTPLANSRALAQWNLRKTYLHELDARGVAIVPTLTGRGSDGSQL